MPKETKAWPVPEILAPDVRWKIEDRRDGGAHCSRASGVFAVPLTPSPFQRAVALHEAAHIRWSPAKPPRTKGDIQSVLACEDYRVNTLVMQRMPEVTDWYMGDLLRGDGTRPSVSDSINGLLMAGREKEACLLVMAAGCRREHVALLPERSNDALRAATRQMHRLIRKNGRRVRAYTGFLATKKAARIIDEAFELPPPPPGCDIDKELQAKWSPMAIEEPPLTLPTLAQRSIRWRASEAGGVVRDCSRLHADGQIFGRRVVRKERGGVLIVDGSGSVGLRNAELDRLLAYAPAATIAIYSEIYSDAGPQATLSVLARNGRRVRDLTCLAERGGGNGCDAAALLWGARRPERGVRVWLSDGQVCSYAGQSPLMREETVAAFTAGNYQRAATVDEAIQALAGKRLSSRYIVT